MWGLLDIGIGGSELHGPNREGRKMFLLRKSLHKLLPDFQAFDHVFGDGLGILWMIFQRVYDGHLSFGGLGGPLEIGKTVAAANDVDAVTDLGNPELVRRKP